MDFVQTTLDGESVKVINVTGDGKNTSVAYVDNNNNLKVKVKPVEWNDYGTIQSKSVGTSSVLGNVSYTSNENGDLFDSIGWGASKDRYSLNFPTLANTDIWTTEITLTAYEDGSIQTITIPANTFTSATIGKTVKFVFDFGLQWVLPTDFLAIKYYANGVLLGTASGGLRQCVNMPSGRAHIFKVDSTLQQTGFSNPNAKFRFHGSSTLFPQDGVNGDIDIGGSAKSSDGTPSFDPSVDQTITIGLLWNTRANFGIGITRIGNRFAWPTAAGSAIVGAVLETSSENITGSTRKIYARKNDRVGVVGNSISTDGVNTIVACNSGIITLCQQFGTGYVEVDHGKTTNNLLASCYNSTSDTFFVGGVSGTILKSTNSGRTWTSASNPASWDIYSMTSFGNGFIAVGNSTTQYLSSVDGTNIVTATNTTNQILRSVASSPNNTWLATGNSNAALWFNGTSAATGKSTGVTGYSVYYNTSANNWWVGGASLWYTSDPSTGGTYTSATLPSAGFDAWSGNVGGINSKGNYMIINNIGGSHVLFSTNGGSTWNRMGYSNGVWFGDNASIRLGI